MKIARPEPLILEVRGVPYTVPAITRAQVRAASALDPVDPTTETAAQADERKAAQLRIFTWPEPVDRWDSLRRAVYRGLRLDPPGLIPLSKLTSDEEGEILYALYARHLGWDPAEAVAARRLVKKKDLVAMLAQIVSSDSMPTPAASPSSSAAA